MNVMGGLRARLWGFVFLGAVGAAVALLIAGYGVAVGVGALAGLILGSVAGLLGTMWLTRGFGRSVVVGGVQWSSLDEPSDVLMAELHEFGEISSVDMGATRSLTPVLVTAEANGLSVQLVAIEHHEAGLSLTFDVRTTLGAIPPASMVGLSVADDIGTPYQAAGQGQGGSPSLSRYLVTVIPAPPGSATRLEIRIDRFFDPFPGDRRDRIGPWDFSVALETMSLLPKS